MSTYRTQLTINGADDQPVTVEYEACPFIAGSTDGRFGPKIEPDEPAHIEIESVTRDNGEEIILTTAEESRLEEEIAEWLDDRADQDPPDRDDT